MFGSLHKQGGRVTLVVSVGSASVSLGIVERQQGGALALRSAIHGELPLEERSAAQAAVAIKELLVVKGHELLKSAAAGVRIEKIFAAVHAPLCEPQIVSSIRSLEVPQRVTDALLDSCARAALGDIAKRPDFLGASTLSTLLNGYPTSRAVGKYAETVEIVGLAAITDPQFKDMLVAALASLVPSASVALRPGALDMIDMARAAEPAASELLVAHLLTEGTELVVMRAGTAAACAFVPAGTRLIAERARPGKPAHHTLDELRIAGHGEASETVARDNEEALVKIEPELAQIFGESLAKLSTPLRLPDRVLLIAPAELAEWFGRFLARIDFGPFTLTALPFDVHVMQTKDLRVAGAFAGADLMLAAALLSDDEGS